VDATPTSTVYVESASGAYDPVTIDNSIALEAAPGADPGIKATSGAGIKIKGVHADLTGIDVTGENGPSFNSGGNQGLYTANGASVTVTDSEFDQLYGGILQLSSAGDAHVDNVTVTNSVFGVGLQADSTNVVRDSTFDVDTQGISASKNALIDNNDIDVDEETEDQVFDRERGIDVADDNVTITSSNDINSTDVGILVADGAGPDLTIEGGIDWGSTASGTQIVDNAAPDVSNVQIIDATDTDGEVSDGDTVTITADVWDVTSGVDTVTADASSFGAGSVTLVDDGSGADTSANDGTFTAQITVDSSATDGVYSVTVNATDNAGNGGSQAVASNTLTVDTSPTISSTSLSDDGSGNLEFSFDSDEQLSTISVSVDSPSTTDAYTFSKSDFSETQNSGTYTYTLTTTQAYDDGSGDYTASVDDAIDDAGNNGGNNGNGSGHTATYNY
jgi:hypothetical protein